MAALAAAGGGVAPEQLIAADPRQRVYHAQGVRFLVGYRFGAGGVG